MRDNALRAELDEDGCLMHELPPGEYARVYRRRPFSLTRRLWLAVDLGCLRLREFAAAQGAWTALVIGAFLGSVLLGQAAVGTLARRLGVGMDADTVHGIGAACGFLLWAVVMGYFSLRGAGAALPDYGGPREQVPAGGSREQNSPAVGPAASPELKPVSFRTR